MRHCFNSSLHIYLTFFFIQTTYLIHCNLQIPYLSNIHQYQTSLSLITTFEEAAHAYTAKLASKLLRL